LWRGRSGRDLEEEGTPGEERKVSCLQKTYTPPILEGGGKKPCKGGGNWDWRLCHSGNVYAKSFEPSIPASKTGGDHAAVNIFMGSVQGHMEKNVGEELGSQK